VTLLQCLREEFVRRDYAAPTIRSYVQIVEAFRHRTGARLDRITPLSPYVADPANGFGFCFAAGRSADRTTKTLTSTHFAAADHRSLKRFA